MPFPTDRKQKSSILRAPEARLARVLVRFAPAWVESHHLTLASLVWIMLAFGVGVLAQHQRRWLPGLSVLILLQYVTDAVDGKIGRLRGDGLVRWGYYMDHFLDYIFLQTVLSCYGLMLPPDQQYWMFAVFTISGGFMVSAFLAKGVTSVLPISYLGIGPAEIRVVFVCLNTWIGTIGERYMVAVIPYVIAASGLILVAFVYQTQQRLWMLDRDEVSRSSDPSSAPSSAS